MPAKLITLPAWLAAVMSFALVACGDSSTDPGGEINLRGIQVVGHVVDSSGAPVHGERDSVVVGVASNGFDCGGEFWGGPIVRPDSQGLYRGNHRIPPVFQNPQRCLWIVVGDFARVDTFGGVVGTVRFQSEGQDSVIIDAVFEPRTNR